MSRFRIPLVAAVALTLAAPPAPATDPPPDTHVLTAVLRDLLLKEMPTPLVESTHDWGKQSEVVVGRSFHRSGPLRWDVEPRAALKNDGHWYKVTVVAKDPQKTLALGLKDVRTPTDGTLTFDVQAGLDVDLTFEQQFWRAGARLYSGETRGRCRAAVLLKCEATNRFERAAGAFFPTAVFRVRVTEAQLFYDDLVIEHTLGVGGDAAKLIGERAHKIMTRVKPSLERNLLARANAGIVKAGDTKDVRVEFDKLFAGQSPVPPKPKK